MDYFNLSLFKSITTDALINSMPDGIITNGSLSFFGREHEMLTKPVSDGGLGYTYNPSTFTYTK